MTKTINIDLPVGFLEEDLSVRAMWYIENAKCVSIRDLIELDEGSIKKYFGRKTAKEIHGVLGKYGRTFKNVPDGWIPVKKIAEPKPRHEPFGRPTKYDPKYCEMLIEHMAKGMSYESFAGILHVSRAVLYDWEKVREEFLDAKRVGAERNLLFWENAGVEGLWDQVEYDDKTGKPKAKRSLNSTVWIFNMKNRHRWKDKQEETVEVKPNVLKDQLGQLTLEELIKIAKES